ncbi:MAG: hypothetical protein AABN95_22355 [Acidobacteriota bacterium]
MNLSVSECVAHVEGKRRSTGFTRFAGSGCGKVTTNRDLGRLFGVRRLVGALARGGLAPLRFKTINSKIEKARGLDQSAAGPAHSKESPDSQEKD